MKSVFHHNYPGREKYAKQGCLSLIIPYSQYQQWQSAHRRKDPNHLRSLKISVHLKEQKTGQT